MNPLRVSEVRVPGGVQRCYTVGDTLVVLAWVYIPRNNGARFSENLVDCSAHVSLFTVPVGGNHTQRVYLFEDSITSVYHFKDASKRARKYIRENRLRDKHDDAARELLEQLNAD